MAKYRKKSIITEAQQWHNHGEHKQVIKNVVGEWDKDSLCKVCGKLLTLHGIIETLEGEHVVCPGDFIIKGVQGEFYPCKPSIFKETYDET